MPKQRFASEKTLMKYLGVDRGKAKRIRLVVKNAPIKQGDFVGPMCDSYKSVQDMARNSHHRYRLVERQMCALNEILNTHGIEAIYQDSDWVRRISWRNDPDPYWFDTVLLYCNNGDTYKPTICYDTMQHRFLLISWGDWYETNMREVKRKEN